MVKILIADDHEVVRLGLRQILIHEFKPIEFGEAVDAMELLQKVREEEWDLVVLDVSMPGRSGLDALVQIRKERSDLRVLLLSIFSEQEYALQALTAGAAGYLTKQTLGSELVAAVKKILAGGRYITPTQVELLAAGLGESGTQLPHEKLSDREFEVMKLIAAGKRVKEIARQLSLGEKTVFTYRARLLEKMGLKNDVELARYALKNHLMD